ncbi:MAG TPA: prolyl oligopeptidase family serine peptidase [Candidatus Limnocylindrales bacterium]|nr:prolyl oligopeptidase family serine peptidase [Candidatus Limnocylindrales bacterium]
MNRALKGLLCLALMVSFGTAPAQKAAAPAKAAAASSAVPPVIDREIFFGNPEIAGAQVSPDGKYLAFIKPYKDTRNVWVKGVNEPFSAARLLTTETKRPIAGYFWTRDGKYILYVKDNAGDENFNIFAVDPAAKPAAGADAPPSRDLTGVKGARVMIVDVPKHDPDTIFIGLNDRDKAWHDLYKLKLSTGEKTLVRKNTDRIAGWEFDLNGNLRLATRTDDAGSTEILRVDPDKLTQIYSCTVEESCGTIRFNKDGKHVYIQSNKGSADLASLMLLDPETGKAEMVESDPLKRVDFGGALFSDVTDELVLTTYLDDKERHYFKDKTFEADYKFLQSKLPGLEVGIPSRTKDEQVWVVNAFGDTEPGVTYLFNRKTHKLDKQFAIREKLPRTALAEMKPVRYKSSDGLEIPAYLTLPKGVAAKSLPLLVIPHGGPWGRDVWGYNTLSQFFANRGYAVLQPNFRASTGYGKKFLNAGNKQWGKLMQDDITWGVKYLVSEGIADPKHVGILGGSYGGYATLAGVTFTPDTYAAAVDIVGPSNLITLLESIPPYWESIRTVFHVRMGNPSTPEGQAFLKSISPLTYADKIKTPLMVVQGANDPRVNKREADQIVIALRDRGFPVEYILAPDEGHGFARPINNLAMYMAAEQFLAKYLGGRYQNGGSPEAVARLKELTVDPKSVVLAKTLDAKAVGVPKPAADLQPGTYKYKATVSMGGQQMNINLTTTIKEENGMWVATGTMDTPGGQATDVAIVEKGTLIVRKQDIQQGPVNINLQFTDKKATGKMNMNGQDRQVDADLGGPLFGDASASELSLAALPLAEGYSTEFRNFDVRKQKEKLMELKVVGSESVTVPAGTFDTYKVEVTSADGGGDKRTLWIAKDSRKPVKVTAVLAEMGGATLTQELVP